MTNEEAAIEIAKSSACDYTESHWEFGELRDLTFTSYEECKESALEMAKWKDRQFNKICDWLRESNIDGLSDSKNLTSYFIKKLSEIYNN